MKWTPEKIHALRKACGETLVVFAARFNLTDSAVHHWENGKRVPQGLVYRELDRIEQDLKEGKIRELQSV